MPWSDLSEVTDSLMSLLTLYINTVVSQGFGVTVVPTPPDLIGASPLRTLSLYLHHVRETAYTQNQPGPGSDVPNVATTPLGLELFYLVTAHHRTGTTFDATFEQRMMGFAMKTFHDNPVVTDATTIGISKVIVPTALGRDNRLNIELRKLEPDQSLSIWTTGDRQFARLAAYYQVSLVLLDPQVAKRFPGIVLGLGAFVNPTGSVTLTGSQSGVRFVVPPSAGGSAQRVRVEPARAGLTSPAGADGDFVILGSQVTTGLRRRLLLRNARWTKLTPPLDRVVVDPALNAATGWTVAFEPERVTVRAAGRLTFQPAGAGPTQTIDVFPGTYTAVVETVVDDKIILGQPRALTITSNEIAFALTPRIANHALLVGPNTMTINLDPAFPLNVGAPQGPLDIQVIVDGQAYERVAPGPPLQGEFTVQANAVTLAALFPLGVAGEHSVRLSVDGADAQPYWVKT